MLVEVRTCVSTIRCTKGLIKSVDGVSLGLEQGLVTALIGESGSGEEHAVECDAALAAAEREDRCQEAASCSRARICWRCPPKAVRQFRWRQASLVFQAAQNALNPTVPIRQQLLDTVRGSRRGTRPRSAGASAGDGAAGSEPRA